MSKTDDVARFLVRTVLDPDFRDLALRAPDEAFVGFDLTDEDKETLRRGDAEMLRLLGAALRPGGGASTPVAATEKPPGSITSPPAAAPTPVRLPSLSFQLNVEPSVLQTPEGLRVTCAVSMQQVQTAAGAVAPSPASIRGGAPRTPWTAWDHDLVSERTRAAVAAVRAAGREERFERILELISAVTSHERVGGPDV